MIIESTLLAILLVAVVADLRTRRIPNKLILVGLSTALAFHLFGLSRETISTAIGPLAGVSIVLQGVGVGFIGMLPLYLLRAMGAGDVKLMMVVGAFLGPQQSVGAIVLTFAAGGVLALIMALWQRSFMRLAQNVRFILMTSAVRLAGGESPRLEPLEQTAGRLPYAVAIAAGTILQLYLIHAGGWAFS